MKSISIRQFQLHAEDYLKELPLTLTRYNVPVAIIKPSTDVLTDDATSVNTKVDVFESLKKQFEDPVYSKEDM